MKAYRFPRLLVNFLVLILLMIGILRVTHAVQAWSPLMYVANSGSKNVSYAALDGSGAGTIALSKSVNVGIAVDSTHNKLYVVNSLVTKSNLDGTNQVEMTLGGLLAQPKGIALDVPNNKMYVVDAQNSRVVRADLDGSNASVWATGNLEVPWSIQLDVANNKVYVLNANPDSGRLIKRTQVFRLSDAAWLRDLGNMTTLYDTENTSDFALDPVHQKLYFVDSFISKIIRQNTDGSGETDLGNFNGLLSSPGGIALDVANNKMYVANTMNNTIVQANLDGTGAVSLGNLGGTLNGPFHIALGLSAPDSTPPALNSFTLQSPASSPTTAASLVFRATFSEDVQNVDSTDFTVNGATTAAVTNVSAVSASVYDVTVSGGNLASFSGTVGLNLSGSQNITDLAENPLPAGQPATNQSYMHLPPTPTVTNVSPNAGPVGGGQSVTVTGTNFSGPGYSATSAAFGADVYTIVGTASSNGQCQVDSATQLTCKTAAHAVGLVTFAVTTPGGTDSLTNGYAFVSLPTLTSISPNAGPQAGGQTVTLSGTNFTAAGNASTSISIGGSVYTIVGSAPASGQCRVVSDTQITCITASLAGGQVSVAVTTSGGTASLSNGYAFVSLPTVTTLNPNSGPNTGGQSLTVTGTNFSGSGYTPSSVAFGADIYTVVGTASSNGQCQVDSATQLTCITLAHTSGKVTVAVATPGGTGSLSNGYTFISSPTITNVNPNAGSLVGGQTVVLTGTNFTGSGYTTNSAAFGADVYTIVGSVPSNGQCRIDSATQLTCVTAAHLAGQVTIAATTTNGTGSLTNGYAFASQPTVTALNPIAGPDGGGQTVTITGTNFSGPGYSATSAAFGADVYTIVGSVSSNGQCQVDSATQLTCKTAAHAAAQVTIAVTTPGGTGSLTNAYAFISQPSVTSISPNSGPLAGGQTVTITGTNFTGTGNASTSISIGGTAYTLVGSAPSSGQCQVVSDTQITCVTTALGGGQVTVVVITSGGTGSLSSGYAFVPDPTVTNINPNSGPDAGGQTVVISGTNFTGPGYSVSSITVGGVSGAACTVDSATQITCKTPAHAAGQATVTVTTPGGTGSLNNGYLFVSAPTITNISPNAGTLTGGQTVTISGTNFTGSGYGINSISIGGTVYTLVGSAPSSGQCRVDSDTRITCVTISHASGQVTVAVATPGGMDSLANGYAFVSSPSISSISPNSGPDAGGQTVVISGANFTGPGFSTSSIKFAGVSNPACAVDSATQITCKTPANGAGPSPSLASVSVTNPGGTITDADIYLYVPPPGITSASLDIGSTAGGSPVVLIGTGFKGGPYGSHNINWTTTLLTLDGSSIASFTVDSATQISFATPAHLPGPVNVAVTTPGGTAAKTNIFTFIPGFNSIGVGPNNGPSSGSSTITLHGHGFTGATGFLIGGIPASCTVDSDTQVTCTTPAHTPGPVDIVISGGPNGTRNFPGAFIFLPDPVTGITPNTGPTSGNTTVTIIHVGSGPDFSTVTGVTFGGTPAASFHIDSGTQITATTPAHSVGIFDVILTGGPATTYANAFTFIPPQIDTNIAPGFGPLTGGTIVAISGVGFTGTTAVTFGGTPAASFTVNSDTSITAITPTHVGGMVDVVVTHPGGPSNYQNSFTFTGTSLPVTATSNPANKALIFETESPSRLMVTFNMDMLHVDPGALDGAYSVLNPANYLLFGLGPNNGIDTQSCAGGLRGDDVKMTINYVTYDLSTYTATLHVNNGVSLPAGKFQLFVCGTTSIENQAGVKLNGGLDDTRFGFTIEPVSTSLPSTGFAPNRVTHLPAQITAYSAMGDQWLEIPRLGIQMNIMGVPHSTDGSWDVTWLGNNAGWLNDTAFPTWKGNSVITGHTTDDSGKPGPFALLNTLSYGDKIIIHSSGAQYVYEVRSVSKVEPGSVASMLKHEELPWVTLVTCQGYDPSTDTYKFRILVKAVLVKVQ